MRVVSFFPSHLQQKTKTSIFQNVKLLLYGRQAYGSIMCMWTWRIWKKKETHFCLCCCFLSDDLEHESEFADFQLHQGIFFAAIKGETLR